VRDAQPEPIPDTGSVRADLVAFLRQRFALYRSRIMHRLLLPVIVESTADTGLAAEISALFLDYREPLNDRLVRAMRAGQLSRRTNPQRLVDMLMGTVMLPLLFMTDLPTDAEAGDIVDQLLQGAKPRPRR
jgi:hypothetical protein